MNPTQPKCANDIAQLPMGDFRPRKVLYENVKDNNSFRLYLQQNATKLMQENLQKVESEVKCCACDKQPKEIKPFDAQCKKLDSDEEKKEESYLDMFKTLF